MMISEGEKRPHPTRSDWIKKKNCEVRLLTSATYRDYREPVADLTFNDDDLRGVVTPHEDALTIHMNIGGVMVTKILVDGGSSANIICKSSYDQMKDILQYEPSHRILVGYEGKMTKCVGEVEFMVTVGHGNTKKGLNSRFVISDSPSWYHAIIGRP